MKIRVSSLRRVIRETILRESYDAYIVPAPGVWKDAGMKTPSVLDSVPAGSTVLVRQGQKGSKQFVRLAEPTHKGNMEAAVSDSVGGEGYWMMSDELQKMPSDSRLA